jgi:hypothetical protein
MTAKKICSAASPYNLLRQNSAKYISELTAARGQPQWISRMLQPTMASARAKATISSQVVGAPHSVKACANRCSVMLAGARRLDAYLAICT